MSIVVLRKPVVTEKSMFLAQAKNIYTFEIDPLATKGQVAEAVESTFGVHVVRVHTVTNAAKKYRAGKARRPMLGEKRKKALVELKQGEKIALFEVQG